MNKSKDRLKILIDRYFNQSILEDELSELSDYILDNDYQTDLEQMFPNALDTEAHFTAGGLEQQQKQNILKYIFNYSNTEKKQPKQRQLWLYIASAAAVLALLIPAIWFYASQSFTTNSHQSAARAIVPGRNTATLKLADGKVISLSETKAGLMIHNSVRENAAGQLSYNDGSAINVALPATKNQLLEVSTPRGGQYQIALPDGTKVWLNASSSLKFPSSFSKSKDRKVELLGEAYFEVTSVYTSLHGKRSKQAFIVVSKDQEVEVLGTHFNINAYADENSTKTTLLEGSVRVASLGSQGVTDRKAELATLVPGMQSTLSSKGIALQQMAEPEAAISWQTGYFTFNREPLDELMRKVSRWYDVNIIYKDESIKKIPFSGTITRFAQVSDLLKILKLTGQVSFEIEGRNIIIDRK